MNNKIHLTFTYKSDLNDVLDTIQSNYDLFMGKIFVLSSLEDAKLMCTYNVVRNLTESRIPQTILVHRKKQTNTLYTINALNELIKNLNNGILDKKFPIDWENYKNRVLLYQNEEFKVIKTKLYKIVVK